MDDSNNRPNHIEDALSAMHGGQWFGWSDSKEKRYADLIIHSKCYVDGVYKDNPHSKPTESEVNAKLKAMQDAWDLENNSYKSKRRAEYPKLAEQFDLLYKDIVAGTVTTNGDFAKAIKAVKDKYTKE